MGECSQPGCSGDERLPYTCSRCKQQFCSEHRLPEKHICIWIDGGGGSKKWFNEKFKRTNLTAEKKAGSRAKQSSRVEPNKSRRKPNPQQIPASGSSSGSKGLLGYLLLPLLPVYMLLSFVPNWANILGVVLLIGVVINASLAPGGPSGGLEANLPSVELPDFEVSVGDSTNSSSNLNESQVERLIHEEINEYRKDERGLVELQYDPRLAEIADYHSKNMADDGEIYHTSPSGQDFEDRYEKFEYDCRTSANEGKYYTGGENVAKSYYREQLEGGFYYETPRELAGGIALQWYLSTGHRENMLNDAWTREGIGVELKWEDGNLAIYVTQNFC